MNAKFLAVFLSLFVITLPAHAVSPPKKSIDTQAVIINKIDLNHADLSNLTGSIKGIGKKRAEAIIAYRESHHGFKSIEELAEVKGFGQNFVKKNREKLNKLFVINQ